MKKTKRLYRSKKERIIGGVCGGIAEYSNMDPTLIRLLWAIGTIVFLPVGIIGYLVGVIIIPEK